MVNRDGTAIEAVWLNNDVSVRKFGYAAVWVFLLAGVLWAGLAPLESAVIAPGFVQIEGKRKQVEHLEGGIVDTILVSNGQYVQKGETLLTLDAAQAMAELQILEARRFNLLAQQARLVAERDDVSSVFYGEHLLESARTDSRAQEAVDGETAIFDARFAERTGEVEVLSRRVNQLEKQLDGLTALRDSSITVATSLEEEIDDLQELLSEGYVDRIRLRDLERSKISLLGEVAELGAQIASVEAAMGEIRLQLLQIPIKFKTQVVDEHRLTQERLYDVDQQVAATKDRVDRTIVRAPANGHVLDLQTTTPGAVILPGESLLEVVPDAQLLQIEAKVSPMDVDRIKIGQTTEVRFSVFKDAYLVSGELTKVSHDSLVDAVTGYPYYSAEVKILQSDLSLIGDAELMPGMPAEVLIKTGERTMLSYVASPLNRLFSRSLIED